MTGDSVPSRAPLKIAVLRKGDHPPADRDSESFSASGYHPSVWRSLIITVNVRKNNTN